LGECGVVDARRARSRPGRGCHVQVSGATTAASDWGIFLGTTFGDPVNTTPFTHQESRALGFLH